MDAETDLSTLTMEQARELLAKATQPDVRGGALRVTDERYLFMRPHVIVNIQKQLEGIVGASTKGFLYLAGERCSEEGMRVAEALTGEFGEDRDLNVKRFTDVVALLGWGRVVVRTNTGGAQSIRVVIENSPIAEAYGPSKKPVCHFLAGWSAGVAKRIFDREYFVEERSCSAQGEPRCEFDVAPSPER